MTRICGDNWTTFDLGKKRLIGFSVILSTPEWNEYLTIRKIRPIFDLPSCTDTVFDLTRIPQTYSVEINEGSVTTTLVAPDSLSWRYYEKDGISYCGARTFTLDTSPEWVDLSGDSLVLTSDYVFDKTATSSATLTVSITVVADTVETVVSDTVSVDFSLTCPTDWTCTNEGTTRDPLESDVPDVVKTELSCVEGYIPENYEVEEWYVPKQGYRLTNV